MARKGRIQIRIYQLVKALGVTEGSFYWHFENRADFLSSLVDYWARSSTAVVVETVDQVHGNARTRLHALIDKVARDDLGAHDAVMWALAIQEPVVAPAIRRVYERRVEYVRSLFAEMGLRGRELDLRTRSFTAFMSMESRLLVEKTGKKRSELIEQVLAFYAKP
jgi:AcrR family transcriptional regulator